MATSEQIVLSDFIKSVHQKLREESKILGVDQAWKNHCNNETNLKKYAQSMQELAVTHWEKNYKKEEKAVSRVNWVYDTCKHYFFGNELLRQRSREEEIALKMCINLDKVFNEDNLEKLKLLDVGSCYNPFNAFSCFDVLAIDIAPANNNVKKCDFLHVNIVDSDQEFDSLDISQLKESNFDVVVFSLLLEYLPSPKQRQVCVEKAYKLLKSEGILIIITPDSKHVGANAKYMKSWRYILAKLGFSRIKYEKLPHIHCMVFRKSLKLEIAERWSLLYKNDEFFEELFIPQDFNSKQNPNETSKNCKISVTVSSNI